MLVTHVAEALLFWLWELEYRQVTEGDRLLSTGGRTLREATSADTGGTQKGLPAQLRALLMAMRSAFTKAIPFKKMLLVGPGLMAACILFSRKQYLALAE